MRYATYSPDDNKLRLYSTTRLPREDYDRIRAAGFKWAPKQELFVAPAWTPEREDVLLTLVDEIGDEDTSLVERAEERAERFEEYSDKRGQEANRAKAAVDAIADAIPLGQPILVGHHSERHARKHAEQIQNGMRKAVNLWKTSSYWADRAEGAIRHAKYLERPDVRARRIKKLESELRGVEKSKAEAQNWLKRWDRPGLTLEEARHLGNYCHLTVARADGHDWSAYDVLRPDDERYKACPAMTVEQVQEAARRAYPRSIAHSDRWIEHLKMRLEYERALLQEQGGTAADKWDLQPGGQVLVRGEWATILRVTRKAGRALSVRTNARYVSLRSVEEIQDYRPPTAELAEKVKAATKPLPLCNYPGTVPVPHYHDNGDTPTPTKEMTKAEYAKVAGDFKGTWKLKGTEAYGPHRVRYVSRTDPTTQRWGRYPVYLTDEKRKDPPKPGGPAKPAVPPPETDLADLERRLAAAEAYREQVKADESSGFAKLEQALKAGVKVVSAPQLFPTPPEVARQVVELADVEPGMSILEPSAGTGRLIQALSPIGRYQVKAVEIWPALADELVRTWPTTLPVVTGDFLEQTPEELGTFDRVVMNPPFANGADIKHVKHALGFLKPGGKLVAIVANGPRQQEQLQPLADAWIDLPDGTFKEEGTNVRTAIVVITGGDS